MTGRIQKLKTALLPSRRRTLRECRHCGTAVGSVRDTCPDCGTAEIATYRLPD